MSIYISNIDIPKEPFVSITLRHDGSVHVWNSYKGEGFGTKAIPVPPHGRCIDADAVQDEIDKTRPGRIYEDAWVLTVLDNAPTIIPAEEDET